MTPNQSTFECGILLARYKRFFADVLLPSGEIVVAHLPNTGSLRDVALAHRQCWIRPARQPERKLRWTLEAIQDPASNSWVGVNTQAPNQLIRRAWEAGEARSLLPHWKAFVRAEWEVVTRQGTRLDACFWNQQGKRHFVEIKNVTWRQDRCAVFPDSPTARGVKHLNELKELAELGESTEILFLVQREDCDAFGVSLDIDTHYAAAFSSAQAAGVKVTCLVARASPGNVVLLPHSLPVAPPISGLSPSVSQGSLLG